MGAVCDAASSGYQRLAGSGAGAGGAVQGPTSHQASRCPVGPVLLSATTGAPGLLACGLGIQQAGLWHHLC